MRILDRYLLKEVFITWAAITAILLLATVGLFLADTLADVARGSVPASLLFTTLGLRSVESITVLVPLSLFLAIMLAYARLYRDSEMAVLSACGISRFNLYRPLVWLVVPWVIVLLLLAMFVSPWAARTSKTLIAEASRTVSVAGLREGRFHEIASQDGVVYVESLSQDGLSFTNAFIHTEREGRKDVVTARRGFQYRDETTGHRYLALLDGFRTEGVPGEADYRWMRFKRNDLRLPEVEDAGVVLKPSALDLAELRAEPNLRHQAEIQWRLAPALAALVLCVLAVPLARTTPRRGYYGNLIVAILVYIIYANLLAIARSWMEQGSLAPAIGLWWVHGCVLLLAMGLLRNRMKGPRRSVRRRELAA